MKKLAEECTDLRPILPIHSTFYKNNSRLPQFWIKAEEEKSKKRLDVGTSVVPRSDDTSSHINIVNGNNNGTVSTGTLKSSIGASPSLGSNTDASPAISSSPPFSSSVTSPTTQKLDFTSSSSTKFSNKTKFHNRFFNRSDASNTSGGSFTSFAGLNSNFSPNISTTSLTSLVDTPNYVVCDERAIFNQDGLERNNSNTVELDPKWTLFREIRVLTEQLDSIVSKYYSEDEYTPKCANVEEFEAVLASEMTKRLELAQALREHKQYAEANVHLTRVEDLAISNQSGKFVPKSMYFLIVFTNNYS